MVTAVPQESLLRRVAQSVMDVSRLAVAIHYDAPWEEGHPGRSLDRAFCDVVPEKLVIRACPAPFERKAA